MPASSQPQVRPTVGGHMCQVRATTEPERHWLIASLIIVWRALTSAEAKRKSPPHRPGVWPVICWATRVYFVGSLFGSRLCWPDSVYWPEIRFRYASRGLPGCAAWAVGSTTATATVAMTAAVDTSHSSRRRQWRTGMPHSFRGMGDTGTLGGPG